MKVKTIQQREITRPRSALASCARSLYCDAPSYLGAAEGICMLVRHFLMQISMPHLVFSTELIIRECLNNAIQHGNDSDPAKRIKVSVTSARNAIRIRVADEGKGFPWKTLGLHRIADGDCNGRGLRMIAAYASRIAFNRQGNVIIVDITDKAMRRTTRWPQLIG
jgi:serine/threonine-protein kinase RsbW